MARITSIYDLEREYKRTHPNGHFFDAATLEFFGETVGNMTVSKEKHHIIDELGDEYECWRVSSRQRNYPSGPRNVWYYFDARTFEHVKTVHR